MADITQCGNCGGAIAMFTSAHVCNEEEAELMKAMKDDSHRKLLLAQAEGYETSARLLISEAQRIRKGLV